MDEVPSQYTQPISPIPPTNNVLPNQKPKRKISLPAILVSLFILIITTLEIGTFFYTKQAQTKITAINDFESCAGAGNPIMESYPEQCSANGKTFTRTLTEEEQKKLDPTVNWKTYTSTNKMFSFKYPENLTFAYISKSDGKIYENAPYFYSTQKEADDAVNCITKQLGTFKKPCDRGFFDVTDVTSFQENAKQPIQAYKSKNKSSVPSVEEYSDIQGRKWDILGPIYGLGGTQTNAETKINNKTYQIQIHIQDKYIDLIKQSPTKQEIVFIRQIIDTFNFTDQKSTSCIKPSTIPQANANIDTSSWKTYTSPVEKGLSFKYPSEWIATSSVNENGGHGEVKGTVEYFQLYTSSGYNFSYRSYPAYGDGGCEDCFVTYIEKVSVRNFIDLYIIENAHNEITLDNRNIPIGESTGPYSGNGIYTKSAGRNMEFIGNFTSEEKKKICPEDFSKMPEVLTTREILRSVRYSE